MAMKLAGWTELPEKILDKLLYNAPLSLKAGSNIVFVYKLDQKMASFAQGMVVKYGDYITVIFFTSSG